jgi:hypothetical protein
VIAGLVGRLADRSDGDVAAVVQDELNALATLKHQFETEQTDLVAQREVSSLAQERLEDLNTWRRKVAANLSGIRSEERRLAPRALRVDVRVWRSDHDRRFAITMRLDLIDSTTRGCMRNLPP